MGLSSGGHGSAAYAGPTCQGLGAALWRAQRDEVRQPEWGAFEWKLSGGDVAVRREDASGLTRHIAGTGDREEHHGHQQVWRGVGSNR